MACLVRALSAITLALWMLAGHAAPASAQGCGPQNPNCIVPTAPPGTSDNRAASTAFVQNATSGFSGFEVGAGCTPIGRGAVTSFFSDCTTVSGTANAIILTPTFGATPTTPQLVLFTRFTFQATATNTAATTIRIGAAGPGPYNAYTNGGVALSGGEIVNGSWYTFGFDPSLNAAAGGWRIVSAPPNAFGNVAGPASAINNNIVVFDGVTGKLIKDSGASVSSIAGSLSVKAFGATGNGSTVDTTAVQNTVNAACATSPDQITVLFPNGQFLLNATITITCANVSISGVSPTSSQILRASNYGPTFKFGNASTGSQFGNDISGLWIIDTNNSMTVATSPFHIVFDGTNQNRIENIIISEGAGCLNLAGTIYVRMVNFDCFISAGSPTGRSGILINSTANTNITNKWGGNIYLNNVDVQIGAPTSFFADYGLQVTSVDGLWLNNFHIQGGNLADMRLSRNSSNPLGNIYVDNTLLDITNGHGLLIDGSQQVSRVSIDAAISAVCLGAAGKNGVYVTGGGGAQDLTLAVGVDGFQKSGIYVDASNVADLTIRPRQIRNNNCMSASAGTGISVLGGNRISIVGGTVGGDGMIVSGIVLDAVSGVTISGVTVSDVNGDGIVIGASATKVEVSSNASNNNAGSGVIVGLGATTFGVVANNLCGNTVAGVTDNSTSGVTKNITKNLCAADNTTGDMTIDASNISTVAKVHGVAYPASPSTNTVPVVTGANTVTYEAVPNAALANPATTVNGQTCTLGSTCTVTAAPSGSAGGDLTGTYPNPTLAAIITAGGPTGSATVAPIITYDAKGRLTAVASATITPAVGSVTGLGTGVATALGVNVGSAGAFVTFNGAGGTPSSITLTNGTALPLSTGVTGTLQAAQEPAHTGDVTNSAGSLALTISNNAVTLAKLATQAANTVLGNGTAGSAVPTALSMPNCAGAATCALQWTAATGFVNNTSIVATTNANLTGPITSSGNATSIASQTGTGTKFVVDTSPTLVTPNIGVANGTSLALSGCTIGSNVFCAGSGTPATISTAGLVTIANATANTVGLTDGALQVTGGISSGSNISGKFLTGRVDTVFNSQGQINAFGGTDGNKQVWFGYDTSTNRGFVQAIFQGVGIKPFLINPSGGNVVIGANGDGASTLDVTGTFRASETIKTGGYTVATLPAGAIGMRAYVTDADACTFLSTVVHTVGTTTCPVFYDGTTWKGG